MLCIPEEYTHPKGMFEELYTGLGGPVHELAGAQGDGRGGGDNKLEFVHAVLEVVVMVRGRRMGMLGGGWRRRREGLRRGGT